MTDPTVTEAEIDAARKSLIEVFDFAHYPSRSQVRSSLLAAARVREESATVAKIEELAKVAGQQRGRAEKAELECVRATENADIFAKSVDALAEQAERAEALLDVAKSQIDHIRRERETLALNHLRAEAELTSVSIAIGSNRWLDPPDGGDVSLAEQVTRMRATLEKAEREREAERARVYAKCLAIVRGVQRDAPTSQWECAALAIATAIAAEREAAE